MTPTRRRLLRSACLGAFAVGGSAAYVLIERRLAEPDGPMIVGLTQTVPKFALPGLTEGGGFATADLTSAGRPVLLNFFASWCAPCVREAPSLMKLRQAGLAIWGVAFKDKPEATAAFLRDHGDPYVRIARDDAGTASVDFGLTGVPETFLVDRDGDIRWRWAGGLSDDVVSGYLDPILRGLV